MSYYNSLLWENPQVIYPLNALKESFGHYISACQHIIRTSRLDLNQQANLIVEANSPFELKSSLPHKTGALLIHGLLDSPFSMRDIGHSLYEQGLSVRSILLPGHGTVPGNLLNITFQEWAQACHYAMTAFTEEVEKVFLVGFSTGATLALYHALQHAKDPRIAGLVLVCPAIKINTPIDFLLQLSPYFHWLGKRGEWIRKTAEIDYTRYQSIAFNQSDYTFGFAYFYYSQPG
jgi:esterase/lipase